MPTIPELIETYLAGPKTLRQSVRGFSREQLLLRPVAGKWSALEVVCHLADFDPIIADRMKRVIAEDKPQLLGASEVKFAAALAYHQRDIEEELAIIDNTRRQMVRILRSLPADAFKRTGIHNERGPLTLEQLLTSAGNHITHHVKFVDEKRKALDI